MRRLVVLLSLLFISGSVMAQQFAGTYAIATSNGSITLTLQDQGGSFAGTLVGDDGGVFQVEAEREEGALVGYLYNQGGGAGFEAHLEGNQLRFVLVPVDAQGNLNYQAASEFMLDRQAGGAGAMPPQAQGGAAPQNPPGGGGMGGPLGGPAGSAGGGLAGTYAGSVSGTPTTLTLQLDGGALQGRADAGGYIYTLQGQASGNQAQGRMTDPQTGGVMNFEIALAGDQLTLTLITADPYTGQQSRTPIQFRRGAAAGGGGGIAGQQGMGGQQGMAGGGAADGFERDPALVGAWMYTESYSSGSFSGASQVQMQINPDGTYLYGNSKFAGGGPGISGSSGGGDVTRGQWRTQNRIVYIKEPGMPQWTPYARYYVEGTRMMFTFGDGSKQIWYRQ